MTRFVLVFISLITYLNVAAQVISGRVTDDEGTALPLAHVVLTKSAKGVFTDPDGQFWIFAPTADEEIQISYIGFESHFIQVSSLSSTTGLSISLKPKPLLQRTLIVEGLRTNEQEPFAHHNLDSEYMKKHNTGQDIPMMLEWTPSTVTTSDAGAGVGYTGMRIRGSDGTRINVTVNGIPINDAESHGVFWVNMPDLASSTQSIQIQRGVGSSTNGAGAFGASINIETSDFREKAYAEVIAGAGSFNTQRISAKVGSGLINNTFSFDARLSQITSDGYIDRASSNLRSYYLSASILKPKYTLKLINFWGNEVTYQSWWGVPSVRLNNDTAGISNYINVMGLNQAQAENLRNSGRTYNYYDYENQVDNYTQNHWQAHFNSVISEDWNLAISGHYTKGFGYFEEYTFAQNLTDYGLDPVSIGADTILTTDLIRRRGLDNDFFGGVFNVKGRLTNKLDLTLGGSYHFYEGLHLGDIIWAQFASNSQINQSYYNNNSQKHDGNFFAKLNQQIGQKLFTYADAQVRWVRHTGLGIDNGNLPIDFAGEFLFFNPKAGFVFRPNINQRWYASVAVANREPVRNDFVDANLGISPQPETLYDFELGGDYKFKRIQIKSNAFLMWYQNQLVLTGAVNDVGAAIRQNVDESYRAGLESELMLQLKLLQINAAYTISQNQILNYTQYIDNWDTGEQIQETFGVTTIAFSPNHIAQAEVKFLPPKVKSLPNVKAEISLFSKYVSSQYLDNTQSNEKQLPAYFTQNLKLRCFVHNKLAKQSYIDFTIFNLLNALYVSNGWVYSYQLAGNQAFVDGLFPQAPRNFMFTLGIDF